MYRQTKPQNVYTCQTFIKRDNLLCNFSAMNLFCYNASMNKQNAELVVYII